MELFYIVYLVLVLITYLIIHKKLSIFREPVGKLAFWLATIVGLLTPTLSRYMHMGYLLILFVALALVLALVLSFISARERETDDVDYRPDLDNQADFSWREGSALDSAYQLAEDIENNLAEPDMDMTQDSGQIETRPQAEPISQMFRDKKIETVDKLGELVGKTEDRTLDLTQAGPGLQLTSLKAIEPISKERGFTASSTKSPSREIEFHKPQTGLDKLIQEESKEVIRDSRDRLGERRVEAEQQVEVSQADLRPDQQDFINLVKLQDELYKNKSQRKYQKAIDIANEIHRNEIPNHVRQLIHMELADLYLEIPDYKKAKENLDKIIVDEGANLVVRQEASDKVELINLTAKHLANYKKPELAWSQVPRMIQMEVVDAIKKIQDR